MPSNAIAFDHETDAAPSGLDFYRTRDDMVRAYSPQTEEERLLVSQIARAWLHLQRFHDFEARVLAEHDLYDLFTHDLDRYKLLARGRAEAERQWRNAVAMFERARRRRTQEAKPSPPIHHAARTRLTPLFAANGGSNAVSDAYNRPEEPTCSSKPGKTASNSTAAPSS